MKLNRCRYFRVSLSSREVLCPRHRSTLHRWTLQGCCISRSGKQWRNSIVKIRSSVAKTTFLTAIKIWVPICSPRKPKKRIEWVVSVNKDLWSNRQVALLRRQRVDLAIFLRNAGWLDPTRSTLSFSSFYATATGFTRWATSTKRVWVSTRRRCRACLMTLPPSQSHSCRSSSKMRCAQRPSEGPSSSLRTSCTPDSMSTSVTETE